MLDSLDVKVWMVSCVIKGIPHINNPYQGIASVRYTEKLHIRARKAGA